MATTLYRDRREARAFLCHLWISASCIVLAAVFFGISSINKTFIFVGIVFLVLALLVFSFYFMCRNRRSKDEDCCVFNTNGQCCFYCCDGCIRTIFCLGPRRAQPSSRNRRIALHNGFTQRERARVSSIGYDNFAMARPTSATPHVNPPAYSSGQRRAELRNLETLIYELLLECSRIQEQLNGVRDAPISERSLRRSDRELLNIHDSLGTEFGLLRSWIEGNRDIPLADLERMRNGLQHLQRRLGLLENGVRSRPMSNTGSTQQSQTQPTRASIVGVASLTGPLPPSVHHTNETPIRRDSTLPPPYREDDAPQTAGLQAGGFDFMGSPNNDHFRLPYYLVAPTLAPPEDDSGAPPSYEEASSSQV